MTVKAGRAGWEGQRGGVEGQGAGGQGQKQVELQLTVKTFMAS